MANKRTTYTKKRVNPLQRPMGRTRRPTLNFDGTTLNSTTFAAVPIAVNGLGKGAMTVDTSSLNFNTAGQLLNGCSSAVASITQLYSQYNYKTLSVEYIPNVGPGNTFSGSRVHIAYIDGPEKMALWRTADNNLLGIIRGCRNIRSFNAWERFTYRVPLSWRRKEFDVNTNAAAATADPDELERGTQGIVMVMVESDATISLGTFKIDSVIAVRQLNLGIIT